jgi:DNA-binding TFAR19-related protein (PDSD5 family)
VLDDILPASIAIQALLNNNISRGQGGEEQKQKRRKSFILMRILTKQAYKNLSQLTRPKKKKNRNKYKAYFTNK